MKKILILVTVFVVSTLSINAQFEKALKKAGKSVANTAGNMAADMAADAAGNAAANNIVVYMDKSNNVYADNSAYTKRLVSLVEKGFVDVDGLSLDYKVYENSEANILACANGSIRVYSGMMDLLTDDELLAVIANQIGHIANKDCRDALMEVASEGNAANATSAQLDKLLSFSGDKLGTIINELIQIPYSEKQNDEADKYAVALLQKNGKNASALVSALEKFATMEAAMNDDEAESSPAYKYIKVNSNNARRASLVASR